jgi:multiple sugar transport system permease protein
MLPLLIVILGVVSWPLAYTVGLSFTDAGLVAARGDPVGIANYVAALGDKGFRAAFLNTAWFTTVSVSAEVTLGVLTALLLNQRFYGRTALRARMILPWALPTVVNAILWRLVYNPEYGALNSALLQLGVIDGYRSWLGKPDSAMMAMIVADVWKNFPIVALICLAALQSIPRDTQAAAIVDGAGPWARFRYVAWPHLAGPLMIAVVLRTIEAFKVFDIVWIMTRGGPANSTRTLSILVYQEAFSFQRAGSGASMALMVTLVVTLLAGVYVAVMRRAAQGGR